MKKLIQIVRWLAGITLALSAATLIASAPFAGVSLLISSILLIPPTARWISRKVPLNRNIKIGVAVGCFIIGCVFIPTKRDNANSIDDKEEISEKKELHKQSPSPQKSNTKEPKFSEEKPPLRSCSSSIGKIRSNGDGSIGSKTELTELLKQLKNSDCDLIEINYISLSPPDRDYADMPIKITYDKVGKKLCEIYTETNVIEEYENINKACLTAFLKSGKKDFHSLGSFCENASYNFNNKEMKQVALGPEPKQSEWDGSVEIVEKHIKTNSKNEASIEFLEWSKVSSFGEDWVVRCKYKGTNSFGAIVTENAWFYIQNNKVVSIKEVQ